MSDYTVGKIQQLSEEQRGTLPEDVQLKVLANVQADEIAALRATIARLEREKGLLVDLVEEIRNGDPFVEFMPAYRKTIDDGALK